MEDITEKPKEIIETQAVGHVVTADELRMDEATIIREQERLAKEKKRKIAAKRRKIFFIILAILAILAVAFFVLGKKFFKKNGENVVTIKTTAGQTVTYVKVNSINGNEINVTVLKEMQEQTSEDKAQGDGSENQKPADQGNNTQNEGETGSSEGSSDSQSTRPGMPEGFDPSNFNGQMPEGFDPSNFNGQMPEGFDPSNFDGQMPEGGFGGQRPGKPGEGTDTQNSDQKNEDTTDSENSDVLNTDAMDSVADNSEVLEEVAVNTTTQVEALGKVQGNAGGESSGRSSRGSGQRPDMSGGGFGGSMPEGFDPSSFGDSMPEGFDPSSFGGNGQRGSRSQRSVLSYNNKNYELTEENKTMLIPVGTTVTTKLGTATTFSRISAGDCLAIVTEVIDGEEVIVAVYIVG